MSQYLTEISEALVRVMSHPYPSREHRLAGYAANIDFWADEVDHCLAALRGFEMRQKTFGDARKAAIKSMRERDAIRSSHEGTGYADPFTLHYGEASTTAQAESYVDEVAGLQDKVTIAVKALFRKLDYADLIPKEKWRQLEDRFEFLKKPVKSKK